MLTYVVCSTSGSEKITRTSENPARASRRVNPGTRWAPPPPLAARPHQRGLARPTYRQPPGRRILRHSSRRVAPAYSSSRVTQSNVPSRYGSVRGVAQAGATFARSEEHTSELQSHSDLVCRLLLEKKI